MALTGEKQTYSSRMQEEKGFNGKSEGLLCTTHKTRLVLSVCLPSQTSNNRHMHHTHPTEHMLITIEA